MANFLDIFLQPFS